MICDRVELIALLAVAVGVTVLGFYIIPRVALAIAAFDLVMRGF